MVRPYKTDPNEESRDKAYRLWHRELGEHCLCTDVDQVEWRKRDGRMVAVAVIELTSIPDDALQLGSNYLAKIAERYEKTLQGYATRTVASRLGCPAYNLVFNEDLTRFALRNLTVKGEWHIGTRREIQGWLEEL